MKRNLLKSALLALMVLVGGNAWAQTTWEFVGNTAVWGAEGVTLSGGNQYDEGAGAVATGGVTFTGTSGFVSTAKGIGFNAVGSTSDENISIVVPAGYKATVSALTSSNRTVVGSFGGTTQTFNASWASSTKEFNNAKGASDVTLYLYCSQNPGGADQTKAPFLERIVLTDMSSVKSFPWTANAIATIEGQPTIIKTYSSGEAKIDEGSDYTVTVEKLIKFNNVYYALNDAQFAANTYGRTFTMGNTEPVHEIAYEKIENIAFYGEVEDIYSAGSNANKIQNVGILSNGGGYTGQGTQGYVKLAFNVPTKGIYTLKLGLNNTNDKSRGFNYAVDDNDVSETITIVSGVAAVQEIADQVLNAGDHTLTLNITYSLTPVFDYLLIEKTGDIFDPETAIVNPSFEADGEKAASNGALELTGWTFAGVGTQFNNTELRPANSTSDTSQFGTSDPSDGDYSLFIRQGWNGNGNVITLTSDAMAKLPAGAYVLSVDYKQYYSYDNSNQANQNTKLGLSVVNGESIVASTTSPAADGVMGSTTNTYFNDTDWSTLELPFTLEQELVDGNVVITFNMAGVRRSDFFVDNVKLIQVPAIDGALAELKKAIDAAQALADSYAIGEVPFTYSASEITPLTNAISTAQGVYDAAESVDAVTTATLTLNAFVATFAPAMNMPEADKTYTFRLRLDVETPLYMALAESGITIAEQATALKFIETENNGEYYLSNADGTLFVGLAGGNAWTMSTAADKKAAWTFTALPDGAHRINNLVTKGRFVGTNAADKEAGKSCYADKQTSNGNVDWIIEVTKIPTGIKTMKAGRESEEIYNLNGQKVMKAQKGLYIINGKKVVVK